MIKTKFSNKFALLSVLVAVLFGCSLFFVPLHKEYQTSYADDEITVVNVGTAAEFETAVGLNESKNMITLTSDITLGQQIYLDDGVQPTPSEVAFKGKIDGNGHEIKITEQSVSSGNWGLFSSLNGAEITNCRFVVEVSVPDKTNAVIIGGLAKVMSDTTISNCSFFLKVRVVDPSSPAENQATIYATGLAANTSGIDESTIISNTAIYLTLSDVDVFADAKSVSNCGSASVLAINKSIVYDGNSIAYLDVLDGLELTTSSDTSTIVSKYNDGVSEDEQLWEVADSKATLKATYDSYPYLPKATFSTDPAAVANLVYDKTDQNLITAGVTTQGNVLYSLDNSTWDPAIPQAMNAGNYTVYAKIEGDNTNYKDSDVMVIPVTIAQAPNFINSLAITGWTYGQYSALTNSPSATPIYGSITYAYYTMGDEPIDAADLADLGYGTYKLVATVEGTANYAGTTANTTFNVAKANYNMSGVVFSNTSTTYTGGAISLSPTNLPIGVEIDEITYTSANAEATPDAPIDVGEYTVDVSFTSSNINYNAPVAMSAILTITPANTVLTWDDVNWNGWVYGDTSQERFPTASSEDSSATVALSYSDYANDNYSYGSIAPVTVGHYKVKAHVTSSSTNYNTPADIEKDFYITKKPITKPTLSNEASQTTYTGAEWIYPLTATNDYKLQLGDDTSTAILTDGARIALSQAGSYTIKVILQDKTNTEWADNSTTDLSFTLTIHKMEKAIPTVNGASSFTYDGAAHSLTFSNLDSACVVSDNNTLTNAGSVAVTVDFGGNQNYKWVGGTETFGQEEAAQEFTLTVTPKTIGLVDNIYSFTIEYGATLSLNLDAEDIVAGDTVGVGLVEAQPTAAGTYNDLEIELTGADAANYTLGENDTIILTISALPAATFSVNPTFASNLTYNGSAWQLVTNAGTANGTPMFKLGNGEYTSDITTITATDAGAYTIYYKIAGNGTTTSDSAEQSTIVTIAQNTDNEITSLTITGWTYGAYNVVTNAPSASATYGDNTITYQYATFINEEVGTYSTTVPTLAGTYKVKASVAGTSNYNSAEATANFTIEQKTIGLVNNIYSFTIEYGATLTLSLDAEDIVEGDTVGVGLVAAQPTAAGTYNNVAIELTGADAANYVLSQNTITLTINALPKATFTTEPAAVDDLEYANINRNLVTAGASSTGTVKYSMDAGENKTWSTTIPQRTDAGSYTVYAKVEGDGENYQDSDVLTINVSIAQASNAISDLTITGWTYGSYDAQTNRPSAASTWGDKIYEYATFINEEVGTYSTTVPTNAGTYKVRARVVETTNYAGYVSEPITFVIAKANNTITGLTITGWTYGQTPNEPSVTSVTFGETVDIVYTYALVTANVAGEYNVTMSSSTAAGNYSVKATLAGTDNYNEVSSTYGFTIYKADYNLTGVVFADAENSYNGSPQTITMTNIPAGLTVVYTYTKGGNAVDPENVGGVGTYTVRATFTNNDLNYNDPTPSYMEATLKINKVTTNSITSLTIDDWTYGAVASTPQIVADFGATAAVYTYSADNGATWLEWNDGAPTAVGSYILKATIADTDNYNGAEKTANFSINALPAATFSVNPTFASNLTYNGSARQLVTDAGTANGTPMFKLGNGEYTSDITTIMATDAGVYTIYYKIVGNGTSTSDSAEQSTQVTIAQNTDNEISGLTITNWTYGSYNAETNAPSASATYGSDSITYEYATFISNVVGTYSTTVPTNAGAYKVKASVAGTSNYNGAEATANFTIAQKTIGLVDNIYSFTIEYGATLTLNLDAEDIVEGDTVGVGLVAAQPTAAGTYNNVAIELTGADAANYVLSQNTITLTINAAPQQELPQATFSEAPTFASNSTYNGIVKPFVTDAGTANGTPTFRLLKQNGGTWDELVAWTSDIDDLQYAEAGVYKVEYKLVGIENTSTTNTSFTPVEITIAKATNTITGLTISDWTYGSNPNAPSVTSVNYGNKANIVYTYALVTGSVAGEYNVTMSSSTAAGNYAVKATLAGDDNYNAAVATFGFTIAQKTIELDGGYEITITEGETVTLNLTGVVSGDTVDVGLVDAQPTVVGPHNNVAIELTGADAANYVLSQNTITLTIDAATPELPKATFITTPQAVSNLVYNGQAQNLVSEGVGSNGTVKYSMNAGNNATWSESIPQATNAGDYTVYAKVEGDGENYQDSDVVEITVSIARKAIVKPVKNNTVFVVTDEALTYLPENDFYTVSELNLSTAGVKTVVVSLKDKNNTAWADGTIADLNFRFEVLSIFTVEKDGEEVAVGGVYGEESDLPDDFVNDYEVLDIIEFTTGSNASNGSSSNAPVLATDTTSKYNVTMGKKSSWGNNFALKYIDSEDNITDVKYTTNNGKISFTLDNLDGKLVVVKDNGAFEPVKTTEEKENNVHVWIWVVCFAIIGVGMLVAVFLYRRNRAKFDD